jgi:hypothetical protein
MAEVIIRERLWQDFMAVARQKRRKAEKLAERVLRDYVQRVADEELLQHSELAARRTKFPIDKTEEIIRRARRGRKRS